MTHANNVLELIGNTPLLKVQHMDTGCCELFLKLECQNPGGSIKDRVGLSVVEAALRDGRIKPGDTLVEATAGNTGLGLALVAAQKGLKLLLVIPDKMSQEKISHLRALGATIVMTRSDVEKGHPQYYQDMAERIARQTPRAFYVNQFNNPANPAAHEKTTGPEIWEQMERRVDAVVCGVGSGGTVTGISRYFAEVSPRTEFILADPAGSILAEYVNSKTMGRPGSWFVEGIGEDFLPPIADFSHVTRAYSVSDAESFAAARELLRAEGVLAGSSSGTLLAAALHYCRDSRTPKRVVSIVCDTGNKYLSKMYSDYWMTEQGLMNGTKYGDLRDLVGRPCGESAFCSVKPDDTMLAAYRKMRMYEYSQLPVMNGDLLDGIIDESDVLLAVSKAPSAYNDAVSKYMTAHPVIVESGASLTGLAELLHRGLTGVIFHEGRFYGLVTRVDMLAYLRRQLH